jgi:hypothetical protein
VTTELEELLMIMKSESPPHQNLGGDLQREKIPVDPPGGRWTERQIPAVEKLLLKTRENLAEESMWGRVGVL